MTLNELIAALHVIVKDDPDAGHKEVRIDFMAMEDGLFTGTKIGRIDNCHEIIEGTDDIWIRADEIINVAMEEA